jgi:hypothetical protein
MAFFDSLLDGAGKAARFAGRGIVHVGGGAGSGALTGAKWGAGLAFMFGAVATAGAAALGAVSILPALGVFGVLAAPLALATALPGPTAKAFAFGVTAVLGLAMAPLLAGMGTIGLAIGLAGFVGASASALTGWGATKYGAVVGGALGAIGRIFSFGAKEGERATVIEQHKILEAQQNNAQAQQYEAAAHEKLTAMQQKAASYQMENPLAKEGNAKKVLENRVAQPEQTAGMAMGAGA